MKNTDEELILNELCSRLPFHPEFTVDSGKTKLCAAKIDTIKKLVTDYLGDSYPIECTKLILRPLSDMTEDEKKEYHELQRESILNESNKYIRDFLNWIYKNNFDYSDLIKQGLASASV